MISLDVTSQHEGLNQTMQHDLLLRHGLRSLDPTTPSGYMVQIFERLNMTKLVVK